MTIIYVFLAFGLLFAALGLHSVLQATRAVNQRVDILWDVIKELEQNLVEVEDNIFNALHQLADINRQLDTEE